MWPPQSVKMWRTPACLSVRATRCPPFRSVTALSTQIPIRFMGLAALAGACRGGLGDVDDFELEAIRVFEEDGVVAGAVLGELARRRVEGDESARGEELFGDAVDVCAVRDAEGDVVETGALAVKARGGVAAGGLDEPDGRAAVGVAGDARVIMDALEFEIVEEIAVEGQRDRGIEDVHLDVVDEGLHRHSRTFIRGAIGPPQEVENGPAARRPPKAGREA